MDDLTKKEEKGEIEEKLMIVTEEKPMIVTGEPMILEEIEVEQISVDGICGVY